MVEQKEIKVDDISPKGVSIQLLDADLNPITGLELEIDVGEDSPVEKTTDDQGLVRVTVPDDGKIGISVSGNGKDGEVSANTEAPTGDGKSTGADDGSKGDDSQDEVVEV